MRNKKIIVYTENPEEELRKKLLQYTYKAHIRKYFERNFEKLPENWEELSEIISSSILQADEYLSLSANASLYTAPLLLYYGTINLALGTATLLTGNKITINGHGMTALPDYTSPDVGNTKVHFVSPKDGGVSVYLNKIGKLNINLTELPDWTLRELLLSIPELYLEAVQCYDTYESYCFPLETVITEDRTFERISDDHTECSRLLDLLHEVPDFENRYVVPQLINADNNKMLLLNYKYQSEPICYQSHTGQSFLLRGHLCGKKLIVLPQWAYMYSALFMLSSLCRYEPRKWNRFITYDESGEKLLIEKFIYLARRLLPNMLLSSIEKCQYTFEDKKYEPTSKINILGEHEIKTLIDREMDRRICDEKF